MIYKGHNFEVPLPAPQFKIYHVDTLSMPLESVPEEEPLEEPRHSVAGVMTRAQRRAAQERLQKQPRMRRPLGRDLPGSIPQLARPGTPRDQT